jgi:hypothetical protein
VLFFMVLFGALTAAALDIADTGLRSGKTIAGLRDSNDAVESAVDGAINSIRNSSQLGRLGSDAQCGPFSPQPAPGEPTVTVTCQGEATASAATDDQPPFSVMTVGTGTSEGFFKSRNATLTVEGGIFSHSVIAASQGSIQVIGDAIARGACNGTINATSAKQCSIGGAVPYPTGNDPAYPAAVPLTGATINAMAADPDPVCVSGDQVVKFFPGLYSEKPGVLLENTNLSCKNAQYWWFSPPGSGTGVYYFDLPDGEDDADAATWDPTAENASVIGGTPRGWSPAGAAPTSSSIPGACNPDPAQPGVQFIFGGRSILSNQSNNGSVKVEICAGTTATTPQKIAVYGLCPTVGAATGCEVGTRTSVGPQERDGSSAVGTGPFPNNAGAALGIGGGSAAGTFPKSNGGTAGSVTVGAFQDIPGGAQITSALIEIRHSETGNNNAGASVNISASWTSAGGDVVGCPLSAPGANRVDQCDITDAVREGKVDANEFNGIASVTFNASRGNSGPNQDATVSVDAIVLRVTYLAPGFEPHRCATLPAANQPPTCSLLSDKNNPTIAVQGTAYAPSAAIRVSVHNKGETLFRRGVIARHIEVSVSNSSKQDDSPFQLAATTASRQVLFTASVGGVPKLRAHVRYTDIDTKGTSDPSDDVALPGFKVEILDWVVLR